MNIGKFLELLDNASNIYSKLKYKKIVWRSHGDLLNLNSNARKYSINRICNGLIIGRSGGKYRVYCHPRPHFLRSSKAVDNWEYPTVYKITDGSIFNIYNCGGLCDNDACTGSWHWATSKSCDISAKTWRGVSYADAISAIDETDYSALDPAYTYTVGLRHVTLHPFERVNKMWFISCQNNETGKMSTELPAGFTCDSQTVADLVPYKCSYYRALIYSCKHAYNAFKTDGIVNYGYVIQSKDKLMLFESNLFSRIKNCIYKFPKIPVNERNDMAKLYSDWTYVLAINYMNKPNIFITLFPKYKDLFDRVADKIAEITNLVALTKVAGKKLPSTLDEATYKIYMRAITHVKLAGNESVQVIEPQVANVLVHKLMCDLK